MSEVVITIGTYNLTGRLEPTLAPRTVDAFRRMLPFKSHVVHVRWSGQAVWVPMGEMSLDLPPESATSYPVPGEVLLYPGGISETEILIPYGGTRFASKAGQLAGNHFLTLTSGLEHLAAIGKHTLWHGALPLMIDER